MCEITNRALFTQLEQLRKQTKLSMDDVAKYVGVQVLTYKNWKKGACPEPQREPELRAIIKVLNRCLDEHTLPVARGPMAKTQRAAAVMVAVSHIQGEEEEK